MKIMIAPDSFKESLTALEAADAIEEGFRTVFPDAHYVKVPMADGGEGTVQSIIDATGGRLKKRTVTGPLNEPVEAFYGLSGDGRLAVIEMAAASGLDKIPFEKRNPMLTTTWGFGELILDALDQGVEELLLGLGGSATNDGGAGMLMSLGVKLLDKSGQPIAPNGQGLGELETIDVSGLDPRLKRVSIRAANDVDNPLTGKNGATYVYGPQKGGTNEQLAVLDQNLCHFASKIKEYLGKEIEQLPGAGAAGGAGGALFAFLDAEGKRGGDLLAGLLNLEKKLKDADLVITGEGSINYQTPFGKTPAAVAKAAKKYGIPVVALAGSLTNEYTSVYKEGIDAVFSILPELTDLDTALENGYNNVKETARNIAALLKITD